jgi:hypothetical protein
VVVLTVGDVGCAARLGNLLNSRAVPANPVVFINVLRCIVYKVINNVVLIAIVFFTLNYNI